ncbi:MAG: M48 family metallopeptidase [Deltaproteobacteria bacterium]|nr:M48 family metallopeptidase [Deltaproteobacteria bacterium]
MAKKKSLYPPAPDGVPPNLTATTGAYMTQTLLVMASLGMFFMLYFGIMFFCLAFAGWALFLCPWERGFWPYVKLVSIALIIPAGVLFIYMLKNLLKFQSSGKPDEIELFEDEHPQLFQFIHKVCDEVGAPYPSHVYVDFQVNAAAIPDSSSIFNLILPTRRSLLIGLGLVNSINLTEFKAMLAHEFGHFAQGAKIGYYFQTMAMIIYHVVYGQGAQSTCPGDVGQAF